MRIEQTGLGLVALLLALALGGCGGDDGPAVPDWHAPADHEFTLDSTCGERDLIGRFRVDVVGGEVVEATGLDDSARAMLEHGLGDEVPTLPDLMAEAVRAQDEGADVVDVRTGEDGRPTQIDIDWDADAVDDESCYRITDYSAAP